MKTFEVEFIHVIERLETVTVKANSQEEAIQKAQDGDFEDYCCDGVETGIETKDYKVVGIV